VVGELEGGPRGVIRVHATEDEVGFGAGYAAAAACATGLHATRLLDRDSRSPT
jgi:hypothetical protein